MKLIQCKDQSRYTLEEFYGGAMGRGFPSMLEVVRQLRKDPRDLTVYTIISHTKLCLISDNEHFAPKLVTIEPQTNGFEVRYLMPGELAPWPGASVCGFTSTPTEAVAMAVLGIDLCQGWAAETVPSSDETV